VKRDSKAEYKDIRKHLHEFGRYVFIPGKTFFFKNEYKYNIGNNREYCVNFFLNNKVEIYDGGCFFMPESIDNLKGTFFERHIESIKAVDAKTRSRSNTIMALYKYNTWSAVEYLGKLGYTQLVCEIAAGRRKEDRAINLYQKKANAVLGVPHSILSKFNHGDFFERDIKAIKQLIDMGKLGQLTPERIDFIRSTLTNNSLDPLDIFRDFGIEKVLNYMHRQAKLKTDQMSADTPGATAVTPVRAWHDFQDYRRECHELGWDITNEGILFPKDLYAAHERASALVKEARFNKQTAPILDDFKKHVKKYLKKTFANSAYIFRVCREPLELRLESDALNHCVHSYDRRVAEGTSLIFFVRSAEAPDKPLYTLECNPKSMNMVQMRGKGNCAAPPAAVDFARECIGKIAPRQNCATAGGAV
jgi:hypothetical protein